MTAFCLTTVSLASARLKGRSSPSSERCRPLFASLSGGIVPSRQGFTLVRVNRKPQGARVDGICSEMAIAALRNYRVSQRSRQLTVRRRTAQRLADRWRVTDLERDRLGLRRARSHFGWQTLPTQSAPDGYGRPFTRARCRASNETLPVLPRNLARFVRGPCPPQRGCSAGNGST